VRRDRRGRAPFVAALVVAALGGGTASAATHWAINAAGGSTAEARSAAPAAPGSAVSACVTRRTVKVNVSWAAAAHATAYVVYESRTAGSYTSVGTVTTLSWTGSLTTGQYAFEVASQIGTKWSSASSPPTTQRTITSSRSTCR